MSEDMTELDRQGLGAGPGGTGRERPGEVRPLRLDRVEDLDDPEAIRRAREAVTRAVPGSRPQGGRYGQLLDASDTWTAGTQALSTEVLNRTKTVGERWYRFRKRLVLAWERLPPVTLIREIKNGAELARIDLLKPPAKRDLALYLFDLREGLRFFGEFDEPRVPKQEKTDPAAGEKYISFVFGSKRDPRAILGIKQANAFIRERQNMLDNYTLVLNLIRSGKLDRVMDLWKAKDGSPITEADKEGFYTFLSFLNGPDAVNLLRDASVHNVRWIADHRTGDSSLLAKAYVPNLQGLMELDRQPSNIIPIRRGAGGPASLEITNWTRGSGGTISNIEKWLSDRIDVVPYIPRFTRGYGFTWQQWKIPEVGIVT